MVASSLASRVPEAYEKKLGLDGDPIVPSPTAVSKAAVNPPSFLKTLMMLCSKFAMSVLSADCKLK